MDKRVENRKLMENFTKKLTSEASGVWPMQKDKAMFKVVQKRLERLISDYEQLEKNVSISKDSWNEVKKRHGIDPEVFKKQLKAISNLIF